jgi:hypothetical protein
MPMIQDAVTVAPEHGRSPGVEHLRNARCRQDPDRFREVMVNASPENFLAKGLTRKEVYNLTSSMSASVGAACSPYPDRFTRHSGDGRLQLSLDGGSVCLELETRVSGTIISQGKSDATAVVGVIASGCHVAIVAMAIPH